jgi:predicted metal-binding protein
VSEDRGGGGTGLRKNQEVFANAKPACPYGTADEFAGILTAKTGVPVVMGTHDYH